MQIFNNLPNSIKLVLSLIFVTIAAILGLNVNSLVHPDSSKLVSVEFVVQTQEGKPIEGVEIQFISKGAPEPRLTNTDGYARIEVPNRSDIDVVLRKEGFKPIKRAINLQIDPDRTRTYVLESLSSKTSSHLSKPLPSISNSQHSNIACQQTLEYQQLDFKIKKCEKLNSTLTVSFVIKNLGRERDLSLFSSPIRIFDEAGNVNHATTVFIGDQEWNSVSNTTLPFNTSVKAGIQFEEVTIESSKIALLEIQTSTFKIKFRDLPV